MDDISEATHTFYVDYDPASELYPSYSYFNLTEFLDDIFSDLKVSDCLLPCLRTEATVAERTTTQWPERSMFNLVFNEDVIVKKISLDKFSFFAALNVFGSNLGLWLYQILEGVVGIFLITQVARKIKTFICKLTNFC